MKSDEAIKRSDKLQQSAKAAEMDAECRQLMNLAVEKVKEKNEASASISGLVIMLLLLSSGGAGTFLSTYKDSEFLFHAQMFLGAAFVAIIGWTLYATYRRFVVMQKAFMDALNVYWKWRYELSKGLDHPVDAAENPSSLEPTVLADTQEKNEPAGAHAMPRAT